MIPPLQQHTQRRVDGYKSPEELVRSFNALPSPRAIFTFMPNDWIFALRRMPYEPHLTILVTAHPISGDVAQLATGSASDVTMRELTAGSTSSIVSLLLSASLQHEKVEALDTPMAADNEGAKAKAPYSWATESVALAAAVAAELRKQGDCQKTDWKKGHKAVCRSVASPSTVLGGGA
ncbi:hypothetical protein LTR56_000740 [Elasticomyces elasticus]|nr:hypothetical protein LTR22_009104 [Elasticomyces elasticus]KAK3660364.1 hypothetical protein LTR56_000740 [Elasticomyces elasticus]KAK4929245.1 hypothetical protein LTR49_004142 [Elasticomyces elasticus]KAK5765801.1 hypothetical protein LTS12_004061 [Elasticomyces elasticus]